MELVKTWAVFQDHVWGRKPSPETAQEAFKVVQAGGPNLRKVDLTRLPDNLRGAIFRALDEVIEDIGAAQAGCQVEAFRVGNIIVVAGQTAEFAARLTALDVYTGEVLSRVTLPALR